MTMLGDSPTFGVMIQLCLYLSMSIAAASLVQELNRWGRRGWEKRLDFPSCRCISVRLAFSVTLWGQLSFFLIMNRLCSHHVWQRLGQIGLGLWWFRENAYGNEAALSRCWTRHKRMDEQTDNGQFYVWHSSQNLCQTTIKCWLGDS